MAGMLPEPEQIEGFINDELAEIMPDGETHDKFMEDHGNDLITEFKGLLDGVLGERIMQDYTDTFYELYEATQEP